MPVRLDSALIGAEAPDDPSDAAPPIAVDESPMLDDDPGVARLCRAWGTEEINCADVVWTVLPAWVAAAWPTAQAWPACPPGSVVCGGDVNVEKAEAEAELAA